MSGHSAENDAPWTYEAEHHEDHSGADIFHHVVAGKRHIAEVATEDDARLIVRAVEVLSRVETLAENCLRKACEDRDMMDSGILTLGQSEALRRRAENYDLVADGLRRALDTRPLPPAKGDRGADA